MGPIKDIMLQSVINPISIYWHYKCYDDPIVLQLYKMRSPLLIPKYGELFVTTRLNTANMYSDTAVEFLLSDHI